MINSTRRRLLTTTMICGAFSLGGEAWAQTSAQPAPSSNGSADSQPSEVVVTGSRIARRDYVSDSPIVTVSQKALDVTGSATVETLLNQLPQIVPQATSTSNNPSAGGRAQIQLRGLGPQRTLVLVDGRRTTPSSSSGVIDINTVPAALVDNIEVITGGASAAYGSDAIAGVVNFKLKHHFTGIQLDAQYGETEQGDGAQGVYSVLMGSNFADDRGNAVLSFTYADRGVIFNASRPFSAYSGGSGTLPFGSVSTTYSQAAVNAVFAKYGVAPGTIKSTSKIAFNADGSLIGFPTSSGGSAVNYKGQTGIDYSTLLTGQGSVTAGSYNTGPLNELVLPLQRYTAYSHVDYEVNKHAHVYGQLMFTDYNASEELAPSPGSGAPLLSQVTINGKTINSPGGTGFYVPVTNPFIPADYSTLLASRASPLAPFVLNKRFTDVGPRHEDDRYDVYNLVLGVDGEIGFGDWTYDAYASYGHMEQLTRQRGNVSHQAVQQLLQAPDGGKSLCTGGYNPFGLQPITASCLAYIGRTTQNATSIDDRDVELSAQGSLFNLPAGPLKFAVGTDYRSDNYSFVPDSLLSSFDVSSIPSGVGAGVLNIYAPGVVGFNSSAPLQGQTDAYELYGELFIPVLKDLPLIKSLNIDAGYRFSDYRLAGGVSSYKIDAEWRPVSWLLLRGGFQRAVRAPNVGELYAAQSNNYPAIGTPSSTGTGGDPCDTRSGWRAGTSFNATAVRALCLAQGVPTALVDAFTYSNNQVQTLVGGNPDLHPETADTYSVGGVITPHFQWPLFKHLTVSVDYYDIDISGVISTVSTTTAIDKCFNFGGANPTYSASNVYCSYFIRDPTTGQILTGNGTNANLGGLKTAGEDIQVDWMFGLGAVGLDDRLGSVTLNIVANHLETFQQNDVVGSPFLEYAGSIGGLGTALPQWKGLVSLTYTWGPLDLTGRWSYTDAMKDVSLVGAPAGSTAVNAPSVSYFDLFLRWKINDTFEFRFGVNNIADKQPPFFSSAPQANTDPSSYDVYGRRYFGAIRARF